ncbi:MAG: hypothetical protein IKH71_17780 [Oscillospiraceae bacterium]|nr:hypothetical protein [Oscillospiraceae bacterium]
MLKVGDIVRIRESAYKPWVLEQTQRGDMVVVKKELVHFSDTPEPAEPLLTVERVDNDCFTGALNGEVFDYMREKYYESELVLVEGRRF